jgi:predicted kinase
VAVSGLPGTGKSTLARALAGRAGFRVLATDVIRKELAGLPPQSSGLVAFETGIYTPEWTARTYAECLHRAERLLYEGQRVLVDASFREERWRQAFGDLARRWGVPGVFLVCRADPDVVQRRLLSRREGASDAGWAIYQQIAGHWEPPGASAGLAPRDITTTSGEEQAPGQALAVLREFGLQG